jgi:hypothetical protein
MVTKNKALTTKASTDVAKQKVDVPPESKPVVIKSASKKPTPAKPKLQAKTPPLAVPKTKVALKKPVPSKDPVIVKPKKSKLIRDSFTIPEHEYKLIQVLKERAHKHGLPLKKSELLRAGILKLIELKDDMFLKAISSVEIIKTGRPAKLK